MAATPELPKRRETTTHFHFGKRQEDGALAKSNAATLEEHWLRGFPLGVERVSQRRLVRHGHFGQELARGGNFIAALRHGDGAQPLAVVSRDIAEMFAHQFAAVAIMVLDDELVEALRFVRRNGPEGQMREDVLFVRRGSAGTSGLGLGWHQGESVKTAAKEVLQNLSTDPVAEP